VKVLFLASHLSTGGMPQFLLKRIEALKKYTNTEVFVYEWQEFSKEFTIQRDKIIELIGDNFFSCGYRYAWTKENDDNRNNLVQYCKDKKIDIIHIEDVVEDIKNFKSCKVPRELYNKNHKWKIVETPHSMNYNPNNKIFEPDGYCFTITYHSDNTNKNIIKDVISYPLDDSIVCPRSKNEIKDKMGFRKNGEYHIINVGLWTPGKNQGYAIELAKKLWNKYGRTYIFHFIGNQAGNFSNYWDPLMKDLPPNIIIHGEKNLNDVSEFYKIADLMLFTSTWESWGIVIEEAIANNIKIMAHNLNHYGNERISFIEPLSGNIEDDYELLINTIHSPIKYSINDINTKLNMRSFADKHINLYKNLLNNCE
tara:strand:- start:83 stop:1183 length:1101 start_codon:yes stop_codon:yes gene_type:complete